MRFGRLLAIMGLFVAASGVLFSLQGQSVVGPESSFMYSDPGWISYGLGIAMAGLAISGIGAVAMRISREKKKQP